MLQT
ncbi:hypothetical protein VTH06DRAFT_5713 [Thermothelomyces fergusii]|jgi:hypothetical protein